MPQVDGSSIPFDISVTACIPSACIPSVYHHIVLLMEAFGIELIDTRFSYSVKCRGRIYAHDFDSEIREELQSEIAKFQRLLRRLHWFGALTRSQSKLLNALNPFNYVSMGTVLNLGGFSGDFRYKILKPMFVNFLMATNVLYIPAEVRHIQPRAPVAGATSGWPSYPGSLPCSLRPQDVQRATAASLRG